ncbi:MAG: response regulator transcription factor [Sarcina sp.]
MINILLVEDDRALALGVVYALKKEGFNVLHGDTLKKSRELLMENEIDLILLDVMLPDGEGYTLCEEVRRSGNEEMAIIFTTACDEECNVVLGLDIGADDYISKPVRLKELTSRINAVLRRKHKLSKREEIFDDKIVSGNIEILKGSHMVYKNGEEVSLTLSEYKLMLILIENYPNVMSRNILLEKLWDVDGNFVDANTLNVYIKRLREKIEDDSKTPLFIDTVRGVGYRWKCEVNK